MSELFLPSVSNSDYIRWIIVASLPFVVSVKATGLRSEGGHYCTKRRTQFNQLIARWSRETVSSFPRPQLLIEEMRGQCPPVPPPSPSSVLSFPFLYFYPRWPYSLKRGSSGLDIREYSHPFLLTLSAIPGPVGEAPTLFGGGLQDPTPWPHCRQLESWDGQRFCGARVHPRDGCGREQRSVAWPDGRGVGGEWSGARTFHHQLLPRRAPSLEARPARPRLWAPRRPQWAWKQKAIRAANEAQASWLIWGAATEGLCNETWTAPWKGQVRVVPKRTMMRGSAWPNHAFSPQRGWRRGWREAVRVN